MPKNALILGHTFTGMGEKVLALKFKRVIEKAGYSTEPIIDIFELLGEDYESFAKLNYDFADAELDLMEDLKSPPALGSCDLLLILSWCFSLAALFAFGIHKSCFTAAKLFVHHPNERILVKLYEPAHLIITESLLASEKALKAQMNPAKLLYLPHCYPPECEKMGTSRVYIEQLAKDQGKVLNKDAKVIGCVSRLEYGKNCEFAVEAVRRLALKKRDVVLVLKGNFPDASPYPDYKPRFLEMLQHYSKEPWLLWDFKPTPFPQVLEEYANFDLLLHPSGAEGGSHVVVECLGLNKPVILLNCSTNPYLFKGLAHFVKTTGQLKPALVPFYIPDMEDLCHKLESDLKPPDSGKVQARFHEKILEERIHWLFERDFERIKRSYLNDRKCYDL